MQKCHLSSTLVLKRLSQVEIKNIASLLQSIISDQLMEVIIPLKQKIHLQENGTDMMMKAYMTLRSHLLEIAVILSVSEQRLEHAAYNNVYPETNIWDLYLLLVYKVFHFFAELHIYSRASHHDESYFSSMLLMHL